MQHEPNLGARECRNLPISRSLLTSLSLRRIHFLHYPEHVSVSAEDFVLRQGVTFASLVLMDCAICARLDQRRWSDVFCDFREKLTCLVHVDIAYTPDESDCCPYHRPMLIAIPGEDIEHLTWTPAVPEMGADLVAEDAAALDALREDVAKRRASLLPRFALVRSLPVFRCCIDISQG
jgi:hypothetical protein